MFNVPKQLGIYGLNDFVMKLCLIFLKIVILNIIGKDNRIAHSKRSTQSS